MSVYIPGVEMPTSCSACPMLEGDRMDGLCHAASRWLDDDEYWTWYVYPEGDMDDSKSCNCPLIPVPDHGRLIDADALLTDTTNLHVAVVAGWLYLRTSTIEDAPTIIPADKEDE